MRFSFFTIMSGAPSSSMRLSLLLRFMTRLYRSFKSEEANLPPSSCTMGRRSGGRTGRTVKIIHSGRAFCFLKDSRTSMRFTALRRFWLALELSIILRHSSHSLSRSTACSNSRMASAPMPTLRPVASEGPYWFSMSLRSMSFMTCLRSSMGTLPGSMTTYAAKYITCSRALGLMSRTRPMREGTPRKYQMWETGAASSMWPMRSRRTLARVTSTPHFSHMMPL